MELRLGAQSFTLLNTLRDPTQFRRRQWATRQQHLFFGCPFLSSLEQLISGPFGDSEFWGFSLLKI